MTYDLKLPPHITKLTDKWYLNTETDKYIHPDHIIAVCERYWTALANKTNSVNAKVKYKKNFKMAKKRWGMDF